jgi:hypothetical protein
VRWRDVNAWIGDGVTEGSSLTSDNLSAQIEDAKIRGDYRTIAGAEYTFTAQQIATTDDYASGEERAVYWQPEAALPDSSDAAFYAIVVDPEMGVMCGMLLRNGLPLSRVELVGKWQEGFSVFRLTDIQGENGQPAAWVTPRLLNRIIGIALPTPAPK